MPCPGVSAIAETFGTYEMLAIVGKDNLGAAPAHAASSRAGCFRSGVNAASIRQSTGSKDVACN
jgi:hypothetical protein